LLTDRVRAPRSTDYLYVNVAGIRHWTAENLSAVLENLPDGCSEIVCHPGFVDGELKRKSSFVGGREAELEIFSNGFWRRFVESRGIQLINFSALRLPRGVT